MSPQYGAIAREGLHALVATSDNRFLCFVHSVRRAINMIGITANNHITQSFMPIAITLCQHRVQSAGIHMWDDEVMRCSVSPRNALL